MTDLMFGVGSAEARSKAVGGGVAVNVLKEQRGKSEVSIYPRPGVKQWADFESAGVRGAVVVKDAGTGDFLYHVAGTELRKIDATGTKTDLGSLTTSTGRVYMRDNGVELGIVDGQNFYALTLADDTFATRTLPSGVHPSHISYSQGFFYINDIDTGDIYHNEDSFDTTSWNSLDQSNAEYAPDDLLAIHDISGNILMLGSGTLEVWTYTGNINFVIGPIPGMTYDFGIAAKDSFAKATDSGFFLARDKGGGLQAVMITRGTQAKAIGEPDVIGEWSRYSKASDATGLAVNIEGHPLYIINFPTAKATWVYDATISAGSAWSKWESYDEFAASRGRFFAEHALFFNDKQYFTSYEDGGLYEVSTSHKSDNGDPIIMTADAPELMGKYGENRRHNYVRLYMETGHGLSDEDAQGHNPKIRLGYSDDHGHTWIWRQWTSFGKIGEYDKEVKFRSLGSSKHRKYRVQVSDPVECAIVNPCYLSVDNEA